MKKDRKKTLLAFLEEDPDDSFVRFALAKEYEKEGTLKKALDTYKELQQKDPDYIGLYYHLAAVQVQLNQLTKAIETYDLGIALAKKQADFHALSELHTARTNLSIDL